MASVAHAIIVYTWLLRSISDPYGQNSQIRLLINGGFFVVRSDVFDYIRDGDEFVEQTFGRLIEKQLLWVHRHSGFRQAMDTIGWRCRVIAVDDVEAGIEVSTHARGRGWAEGCCG